MLPVPAHRQQLPEITTHSQKKKNPKTPKSVSLSRYLFSYHLKQAHRFHHDLTLIVSDF